MRSATPSSTGKHTESKSMVAGLDARSVYCQCGRLSRREAEAYKLEILEEVGSDRRLASKDLVQGPSAEVHLMLDPLCV
jgi:hypothetical protein